VKEASMSISFSFN